MIQNSLPVFSVCYLPLRKKIIQLQAFADSTISCRSGSSVQVIIQNRIGWYKKMGGKS